MAPFSTYKPTHNPQFPQSLRLRANARNVIVSLKTLHDGQSTFSTQLITLNCPVILSHRRNTTVSLETNPLNSFLLVWGESLFTLRKKWGRKFGLPELRSPGRRSISKIVCLHSLFIIAILATLKLFHKLLTKGYCLTFNRHQFFFDSSFSRNCVDNLHIGCNYFDFFRWMSVGDTNARSTREWRGASATKKKREQKIIRPYHA